MQHNDKTNVKKILKNITCT